MTATDETVRPCAPIAVDGYGVPFDPLRHVSFVRAGLVAVEASVYRDPCGTGHIDPNALPKEKPAGWWDKTGRLSA